MQTEPIRSKKHIKEMANYYLKQGKLRNYLLIILGIYTGLRISDMLHLTTILNQTTFAPIYTLPRTKQVNLKQLHLTRLLYLH